MSLSTIQLSGKELYAFLNGICKFKYDKDTEMNAEFLRDNIFPEETEISYVSELMELCMAIFDHASAQSFDIKELLEYLKTKDITNEDHLNSWGKVWKSEESKIRQQLILASRTIPSIDTVNWRVDVFTNSQLINSDTIPEPIALVEIKTKASDKSDIKQASNGSIFFEMDKASLDYVLNTFNDIERAIEKIM